LTVAALIVHLSIYASEAYLRRSKSPSCTWEVPEQLFDPARYLAFPPYSVRFCYLDRETLLWQLRDADEKHLLAERMIPYPFFDVARFHWRLGAKGHVVALEGPDGVHISLPPTWLDRLRAEMP
jgi:hypothetical protein